jgi:hypothetical protein
MTVKERTTKRGTMKTRRLRLSILRDSTSAASATSLMVKRTIRPSVAIMVCVTAGACAVITVDIMFLQSYSRWPLEHGPLC